VRPSLPALNPRQGENLAWRWGTTLSINEDWEEEGWYDKEEPNYDYNTGEGVDPRIAIGHFT